MTNTMDSSNTLILIAEDEDISYLLLSNILKRESFDVMRAKNGLEAVELCRKHEEIKLVLMDINMPLMNGLEATTQIKTFRHKLPIIAVTAYTLNNTRQIALKSGCDDYLAKPVNKEQLLSTIQQHH
jgi:CheY-like chemotaxis protein